MKTLGIFTWIAISSLLTALIQAAVLRRLWSWFVAGEYGPGPSLGAWFGIATILGLIIGMATTATTAPPRASKRDESWDEIIRQSVSHTLARWIGCGVALGMTWAIGSLLGWVR
jgi:Mg/Co/Ni transporter MgtE